MLARSAIRQASRFVSGRANVIAPVTRSFNTTSKRTDAEIVQEQSVPVSSYHQGQHISDELKVEHSGPVTSAVKDIEVKAIPLKKSVLAQLTPTLKKFTLDNKVAVVTG